MVLRATASPAQENNEDGSHQDTQHPEKYCDCDHCAPRPPKGHTAPPVIMGPMAGGDKGAVVQCPVRRDFSGQEAQERAFRTGHRWWAIGEPVRLPWHH